MEEKKPLIPNDSEMPPDKPHLLPELRGHPSVAHSPALNVILPFQQNLAHVCSGSVLRACFSPVGVWGSHSLLSFQTPCPLCPKQAGRDSAGVTVPIVSWGFVTTAPPRCPRGQLTSFAACAETAEGSPRGPCSLSSVTRCQALPGLPRGRCPATPSASL